MPSLPMFDLVGYLGKVVRGAGRYGVTQHLIVTRHQEAVVLQHEGQVTNFVSATFSDTGVHVFYFDQVFELSRLRAAAQHNFMEDVTEVTRLGVVAF